MRDYLYLWHQPACNRIIASGVEFCDFVPDCSSAGGVVLLRHKFNDASFDLKNRFDFVPAVKLAELAADDIHNYGDFCWADFSRRSVLAELSDPAIAALAFFGHTARPLGGKIKVPGLDNGLLCFAHDDGYYARVFYAHWDAVGPLIGRSLDHILDAKLSAETYERVRMGDTAFFCYEGEVVECEQTEDMDAIQRKHLPRSWKKS